MSRGVPFFTNARETRCTSRCGTAVVPAVPSLYSVTRAPGGKFHFSGSFHCGETFHFG
jgi:hypothetical protein